MSFFINHPALRCACRPRRPYRRILLPPGLAILTYADLSSRPTKKNPNKLSSPFEFYMVHNRNGNHHLDNQHTVFGEVISGFNTLDKISRVKVGVDEWPIEDIKMTIEIID